MIHSQHYVIVIHNDTRSTKYHIYGIYDWVRFIIMSDASRM
jgi:hypothetical protein